MVAWRLLWVSGYSGAFWTLGLAFPHATFSSVLCVHSGVFVVFMCTCTQCGELEEEEAEEDEEFWRVRASPLPPYSPLPRLSPLPPLLSYAPLLSLCSLCVEVGSVWAVVGT